MCVGDSDSGKTTWLEPIKAFMEEEKIATCTKEGRFAAHMIEEDTQLLFLDEWDPGTYLKLMGLGYGW